MRSILCTLLTGALASLASLTSMAQSYKQRSRNLDALLGEFDEEDLRFNDYENRLEDSFFKYVARTDDYDRNEVPWEDGSKPVQVQMSAYLREVPHRVINRVESNLNFPAKTCNLSKD